MFNSKELIALVKAGIISKEEANKIITDSNDYVSINKLIIEVQQLKSRLEGALNE